MTENKVPLGPSRMYALIDVNGDVAGTYHTAEEAKGDAWGPRFRNYRIVTYQRGRTHFLRMTKND